MVSVATFTLASDEFPLGTVFKELPDVTVQLERIVPDANGNRPYFWVRGTESETIVEQFSKHPGVTDIECVDSVDSEYLMRCRWESQHDSVLDALLDPEVVLLSGVGTTDRWTFEVRGESRKSIASFQNYCQDNGIPVTLSEIHSLRPVESKHELTEKQDEAIRLAYKRGYFDSPRQSTLQEISSELGISQQALASRLRRGNRQLVEKTLFDSDS